MKDETKLFYDLTAKRTADEWYQNDILLPTIKEFVSLLPGDPAILDFGCGPGHESKRMASLDANVTGIDYSTECIRIAKERCPECKFIVKDFYALYAGFGKFDGVFASGSLIHVRPDDLSKIFDNISNVLKKGGYFLAIVRDGEGTDKKWSTLEMDGKTFRRTVYCYRKDHLITVASKVGLEFTGEGYLDKCLYKQNWRNYIFKKI